MLLVDDDINYSSLVRDVLGFAENYSIDRAANLHEMWLLMDQNSYDALLLDYSFPDGTGLDALKKMVEQKRRLPIIIVTGRGDERVAAQAIQQGATDYLVKSPETVFELPVLINKAVRNYAYEIERIRSLEKIRYQALLLENVRDAVVVWDSMGVITYWNPAAERLYGWPAAQMIGRPAGEAYAAIFSPVPVPISAGSSSPMEVERSARTNLGETIWIGSRITELHDEYAGNPFLGYIDVTRDITPQEGRGADPGGASEPVGECAPGGARRAGLGCGASDQQSADGDHRRSANARPPAGAGLHGAGSTPNIEQAGWKAQQAVQDLLEFSRPAPIRSKRVGQRNHPECGAHGRRPIQAGGGGWRLSWRTICRPCRGIPRVWRTCGSTCCSWPATPSPTDRRTGSSSDRPTATGRR